MSALSPLRFLLKQEVKKAKVTAIQEFNNLPNGTEKTEGQWISFLTPFCAGDSGLAKKVFNDLTDDYRFLAPVSDETSDTFFKVDNASLQDQYYASLLEP